MWPLNTLTSCRRSRRSAASTARAALCAAFLFSLVMTVRADSSAGAVEATALREKDVRRAEEVLAKLRRLDEAAAANDASAYRALVSKLYPGLFIKVADMRRSDLHTDLSTAVFLHEELGRTWSDERIAEADCGRERRDIYLPLCLDLRGGTVRQLLLAKSRLHARWAEAVARDYRGERDAETSGALSEMKAARANDLVIAARVVETLKPLAVLVGDSPTHAEYQERPIASKVSFDRLDGEFADALGIAGELLAWLPRSPTFYHLSNARRSYTDGLFWYQKVHQSKKLMVFAHGFARDPLKDLKLDSDQVGQVVMANWQSAMKYTRLAEQSLWGSVRQ
ncbi:MAG: hypothetical protein H0X14_02490 [Acidobacteria bacterium]|nr:hypothetical protein [Acidobacteriota bacterium]